MASEFIAEFRKLLGFMKDPYIRSNLEMAVDRYEKNDPLPRMIFKRDPRNLCVHGGPLGADCGPCIESYGNNQPVMGEWVQEG